MIIYVVKENDSVDSISKEYNIPVERIIYDNQLVEPYALAIGQSLVLMDETITGGRSVIANGFAYPFISEWVLKSTLPFLTDLSVFSYGFTTYGEVVPPVLDVDWMITAAINYGAKPILTLTPFGPDGNFNNNLIKGLLRSEEGVDNLINNLLVTVQEKGYGGVNVDFEYILADDRDRFTEFVAELTTVMNSNGYEVSVDLAPKTSSTQKGLLYEGKDYGGLGSVANHVLLMTYEWGYTYGPPQAVAPLNKVREVVEYAITEIPRNKINIGIPNYGYDWPLPFVKGSTKAKTIGNVEAVRIAIENGVEIQFDEVAQSPFFTYFEDGIEHEVWFEDPRSIYAKLNLVKEYNLRGVGYWQIMRYFRAIWLIQESGEF